jgi:hypothetical protein
MAKQPSASNMRQVFMAVNEMKQSGLIDNYAIGGAGMDIDIFLSLKPVDELVNSGLMDMGKFETVMRRHGLEQRYAEWLKWRKST